MSRLGICLTLFLYACVALAQLPSCYQSPYKTALGAVTCGPMDLNCLCTSTLFLDSLEQHVPENCVVKDQIAVFSYIDAACSQVGFPGLALSTFTTSLSSTTPASSIATITTSLGTVITTTSTPLQTGTINSTAQPTLSSSSPQLSSSPILSNAAKLGIGIGLPIAIVTSLAAAFLAFRHGRSQGQQQAAAAADAAKVIEVGDSRSFRGSHPEGEARLMAELGGHDQRIELDGNR